MARKPGLKDLKQTLASLPGFVVLEYLYSRNDDSPVAPGKTSEHKYKELVGLFHQTMDESAAVEIVTGVRELPFTTLFSIAEMIVYSIVKDEDIFASVMSPEYAGPYLPSHCMNVAFVSCRAGMGMELSFRELTELCVAALLHDIGMTKIHPAYYEHDRALSEEERKDVESHPELGHHFLQKLEKDFPWLLRVILEEHQRPGEAGYPVVAEEKPHIYSRIVGVCDSFEALTHNRSFRKAYHPGDAMKVIIDGKVSMYDREVLRALIDTIGIFPVGSLVQLNTNNIASVIRSVEGSPLRPVVQIVDSDKAAAGVGSRVIDLSKEKSMFITGLVYDERYYIPDQAQSF
ncbi:MAG: HD domain-containing protein [Chitinivibrionales bacterium]|nr:HD domain-containing protein [Chitinivibrionales bacterium]MBD3396552.1 HD domain-containing protein [Chitinivibrionales bacterium]